MDFYANRFLRASRAKTRSMLFFLREYFFPSGCALCGAALVTTGEAWYGLCESCRSGIVSDRAGAARRCDRCGKPLVSEQGRCLPCRSAGETAFDRLFALFPYTGKYRRLLRAYKFGKNLALGNFLAEQIPEALRKLGAGGPGFQEAVMVPVPPRPGKIRETGWDQVEYLAAVLEHTRILPVARCLRRLSSRVQKELGQADRKINLRGRIVLKNRPPETVVLIDDVLTTGSTMEVCAGALKAGGAEQIRGICLFYNV
jgi:ComF family protein